MQVLAVALLALACVAYAIPSRQLKLSGKKELPEVSVLVLVLDMGQYFEQTEVFI